MSSANGALPGCTVAMGLPRLSPQDAAKRGAGSIVVGIAPVGGKLPPHWVAELAAAADAGLDVVSGLHTRLTSFPELVNAAARSGVRLIDVRHGNKAYGAATGRRRSGKRVLTVGTDCALGKNTPRWRSPGICSRGELPRRFGRPARPAS